MHARIMQSNADELCGMGFDPVKVRRALQKTNGDVRTALDMLIDDEDFGGDTLAPPAAEPPVRISAANMQGSVRLPGMGGEPSPAAPAASTTGQLGAALLRSALSIDEDTAAAAGSRSRSRSRSRSTDDPFSNNLLIPTVAASAHASPTVVSTQSEGGWLKAAYERDLEAQRSAAAPTVGWVPRQATTGLIIGQAEEEEEDEEEEAEFDVAVNVPLSPGAQQLDSAGTLKGGAAIKVRSRKPPFFKFKNVFFNLKTDGAVLELFDCKRTPTVDHIYLHRPMMTLRLHSFMKFERTADLPGYPGEAMYVLKQNDPEKMRLYSNRTALTAAGKSAGGFNRSDPIRFVDDGYYPVEEVLVLKEFQRDLGDMSRTDLEMPIGLEEMMQGAKLLIENEAELRAELQEAASGMKADEMPMNPFLMGRYQDEDLLNY